MLHGCHGCDCFKKPWKWNSRNALAKFCNNPTVVIDIGNVTITVQPQSSPPKNKNKKPTPALPTVHFKSVFFTFNI